MEVQYIMAVYLEKRLYSKQEIADYLKLDVKDPCFSRKLQTLLKKMGVKYQKKSTNQIDILSQPSTFNEKIVYLLNLLGIKIKKDNFLSFVAYIYCMAIDNQIQSMPWEVRKAWLEKYWDIKVSRATLIEWTKKLEDLKILYRDDNNFTWQCTWQMNDIIEELLEVISSNFT